MALLPWGSETLLGTCMPVDALFDCSSKLGQVAIMEWPGEAAYHCHQQWGLHRGSVLGQCSP